MFETNGKIRYKFEWDDKMVYLNYGEEYAIDKNSKWADRSDDVAKEYFSYFDEYLESTFLENIDNPYMIIDAEGSFNNLDDVTFEDQLVEKCNEEGLDIFLWEIPIIGLFDEPGITFSNVADIIYDFRKADSVLHGYIDKQDPVCYEFVKIRQFVNKNNLTKVTVNTGLYNQEMFFNEDFELKTRDLYLSAIVTPDKENDVTTFTHNPKIEPPCKNDIDYKFINLNKRYEGFRQVVAAHMNKKDCLTSYIHKHTDLYYYESGLGRKKLKDVDWYWNDINYRMPFNVEELYDQFPKLQSNIDELEEKKVLSVDKTLSDDQWLELDNDEEFQIPNEHYQSAFCAVVNESTFAFPVAHFADKTLNAIKCYRPFILVAPPHTLEYMQTLGFKTFSDFWNEDYDKEENHRQRMESVLKLINKIDKLDVEECKEMYEKMLPILKHNYKLLEKIRYQEGI